MLIAKGAYRAWAPQAFRDFARVRPLHAIGTRGLPWIEIDFPEDYDRAVNQVLPEIEDAESSLKRQVLYAAAACQRAHLEITDGTQQYRQMDAANRHAVAAAAQRGPHHSDRRPNSDELFGHRSGLSGDERPSAKLLLYLPANNPPPPGRSTLKPMTISTL